MKKTTLLKFAVLLIALASFHLFSMPHSVQVSHHTKVVADQETHEFKIVQTSGDEKKHVSAVFSAFTALLVIASLTAGFVLITCTGQFDRMKKHLFAVFYQSSYFETARV
ncbi:hypothetical protein [Bacillus sp. NPDC077027]|uniref:hypothetical protein n=1 Tax=Bacillus sp. NPDC077027 TaxID=3390548 RepID=UPI003D09357C